MTKKKNKRKKRFPVPMKGLLTLEQAMDMAALKKNTNKSYSSLIREAVDLLLSKYN